MLRLARREPSAVLLAAQLGAVVLYPFMEDDGVGRALFSVFGIAVLGLVMRAVRDDGRGSAAGSVSAVGGASLTSIGFPCVRGRVCREGARGSSS